MGICRAMKPPGNNFLRLGMYYEIFRVKHVAVQQSNGNFSFTENKDNNGTLKKGYERLILSCRHSMQASNVLG